MYAFEKSTHPERLRKTQLVTFASDRRVVMRYGCYVPLTLIVPPALGNAKAHARAEMMGSALTKELGTNVTVAVAETYGEVEQKVAGGLVDMAWAPAAVCVKLRLARAVYTVLREGRSTYLSAIVSRRDAFFTLSTLKGSRAVWVDPLSVGGYLLAVARLRSEGVDPDRTFFSQQFVGSHRAAVEAVLQNEADITAVSMPSADADRVNEALSWYTSPAGVMLVPIAFTEPCLNDAFVITSAVTESESQRIGAKLVSRITSSRLLGVLEASGLMKNDLSEYHKLAPLLGLTAPVGRRTSMLPPRG